MHSGPEGRPTVLQSSRLCACVCWQNLIWPWKCFYAQRQCVCVCVSVCVCVCVCVGGGIITQIQDTMLKCSAERSHICFEAEEGEEKVKGHHMTDSTEMGRIISLLLLLLKNFLKWRFKFSVQHFRSISEIIPVHDLFMFIHLNETNWTVIGCWVVVMSQRRKTQFWVKNKKNLFL